MTPAGCKEQRRRFGSLGFGLEQNSRYERDCPVPRCRSRALPDPSLHPRGRRRRRRSLEGAFGWGPTLLAVVGLVLLHAAVNALNEASDMTTGIDLETVRTPFSGGSGTLPAGRLSVRATRLFAGTCIVIAALIGGWFALRLGPWFVLVLVAGAAAVLFYSEVFARSGLGEVFAGLGLGALPCGARVGPGAGAGAGGALGRCARLLHDVQSAPAERVPDEDADRAADGRTSSC